MRIVMASTKGPGLKCFGNAALFHSSSAITLIFQSPSDSFLLSPLVE